MSQIAFDPHCCRVLPRRLAAAVLAVLLPSTGLTADDDRRYAAVEGLGELNGVALQCKYVDQVRRMKSAVVANAPKERSFGLAFDQATNEAFLAFIRKGDACPTRATLERRVGHQIDAMRAAFAKP